MYLYVCMYIYIYIYTYIHTYIHIYIHIHRCICMYQDPEHVSHEGLSNTTLSQDNVTSQLVHSSNYTVYVDVSNAACMHRFMHTTYTIDKHRQTDR